MLLPETVCLTAYPLSHRTSESMSSRGEDDLVSIKQVAMTSEVKTWIDKQRKEQPGHYDSVSEDVFDACA